MGLLRNLQILCGSDVGDIIHDLRKRVVTLETDLAEYTDLSESRFRRLRKRQRDDPEQALPNPAPEQEPGLARARRRSELRHLVALKRQRLSE